MIENISVLLVLITNLLTTDPFVYILSMAVLVGVVAILNKFRKVR